MREAVLKKEYDRLERMYKETERLKKHYCVERSKYMRAYKCLKKTCEFYADYKNFDIPNELVDSHGDKARKALKDSEDILEGDK